MGVCISVNFCIVPDEFDARLYSNAYETHILCVVAYAGLLDILWHVQSCVGAAKTTKEHIYMYQTEWHKVYHDGALCEVSIQCTVCYSCTTSVQVQGCCLYTICLCHISVSHRYWDCDLEDRDQCETQVEEEVIAADQTDSLYSKLFNLYKYTCFTSSWYCKLSPLYY